jgi:hypothetical protein
VRWRWALLDHTRRLAPCRLRTTFAPVNVFSLINPWVLNSLLREIRNAIVPLLHVKHGRHWKTNHQTESDEKTSGTDTSKWTPGTIPSRNDCLICITLSSGNSSWPHYALTEQALPEIKHLEVHICQASLHYILHQASTNTQQVGSAATAPRIHQPPLARHNALMQQGAAV